MRKIAIGKSVNIDIDDFIIETDRIIINDTINNNFDLKIIRDSKTLVTITFPLENKSLLKGDYIDYEGIHRSNTGDIEDFTADQSIAFQQMNGIRISKGEIIVTTSNTNITLKIYYTLREEEDNLIYVLDKYEQLIAVFDKNDEYPILNPRVKETQNAEAVFTFQIPTNNPKWAEIKNPENLYVANGKVFSTNFEGCFQENITDMNEDYIQITAYERQKLLSRRYVRAWNSETGFEKIDTFMVVVLSNGNLPLKNNDTLVESDHLPGTSGYILDALLFGTGWKTGICDVEGIFDFETDQTDIYENILKVQQIWGGILVFDSYNMVVHHRNEVTWLPYEGYEVKYRKNMQSLERLYNNKIVTRLCPLGEGGLNIKSVNDGSEWLTDFTYTDTVLEGIENNPDITDAEQLKRWGKRKLKDLCMPRKELTVQAILLYQLEGYELERVGLNDIVDVIDYGGEENHIEQLRIVGYDYNVWDGSDAVMELSDITLDSTDIFKKTVSASNIINNGTLNTKQIYSSFGKGGSLSSGLQDITKEVTTTSSLLKEDGEIGARIAQTEADYKSLSGEVIGYKKTVDDLVLDVKGLTNKLQTTGGDNLIRNSVGALGNDYWEGTIVQNTGTDAMTNNISRSSIQLPSGNILQKVLNLPAGEYNISFNYKKLLNLATVKVVINEEEYTLDKTSWTLFEKAIKIIDHTFTIRFSSTDNAACLIGDLLLVSGNIRQYWTQNSNETTTDTVKIGKGIKVESSSTNTYTTIDSDGNRTFNRSTNQRVAEMTDKGVYANEIEVNGQAKLNVLLIQEIENQAWLTGIGG